jgi:hypothetical protein
MSVMDHELARGGAYVNLFEDSKLSYRVDPGGESLEIVVFGPMELSIGMTPAVLEHCQEVLAEAHNAVTAARRHYLREA